MKRMIKWIGVLFLIVLLSCSKDVEKEDTIGGNEGTNETPPVSLIGEILPEWEEGYLDIHAINTGRGETTLLIFPDGTTMVNDVGASKISTAAEIPPPPQRPDGSVSPERAIIHYMRHFIKSASNKINYFLLSHFHGDHFGEIDSDSEPDATGTFLLAGVTEVGLKIPVEKIIDRGYPDYNFPYNMTLNSNIANYVKFVNWTKSAYGATAEQFSVGSNDQIVLKRSPFSYSNFEIRNICSNGVVWTGTGTGSVNTFPSATDLVSGEASENSFSIGYVLSYGKFNYFAGGDLQYNGRSTYPWKDIEAAVALVVPEVDVMKANHHGTAHCNGTELLGSLNPQTIIIHPWRCTQPKPETISRMFNGKAHIFSTNMTEANKPRLGADLNKLKAMLGHIVVRVSPGGDDYYVYLLDDTNQEYRVTEVFGPYNSK